jgi:hypothetical protein
MLGKGPSAESMQPACWLGLPQRERGGHGHCGEKAGSADSAFGWEAGTVLAAYRANAETASRLALEQSSLVSFLRAIILARAGQEWIGAMSDLLVALQNEKVRGQPAHLRTTVLSGGLLSPAAVLQ